MISYPFIPEGYTDEQLVPYLGLKLPKLRCFSCGKFMSRHDSHLKVLNSPGTGVHMNETCMKKYSDYWLNLEEVKMRKRLGE